MPRKKRGPQSHIAAAMYALNQRRLKVWIPFLKDKIAELRARIEDKRLHEAE
jgi:hypothetical protein